MAQERQHKRKRRRRGRFPGLYRLVSVVLILLAVAAACVVFFRVDQVTVQGNERYTAQEIIDVAGVKKGDNLFGVNKSQVARELRGRLPYIQSVSVRRLLPDTLSITVTEGPAVAAIAQGGRWWLMGSSGKLLEETDDPGECPTVTGLAPLAPAVGTYLAAEEAQQPKVEVLKTLLTSLEDHGLLDRVGSIDLTADYEVVFTCADRFTVYLSTTLEKGMDYWLRRFATYMTDPAVAENQPYNVYIRDDRRLRFIPQ